MSDLQQSSVVTLTISNGTVTDTVKFTRGSGKDGTMWQYNGNDSLNGVGLDVEKMSLWWAPDKSNWAGIAGFHIAGEFKLPGTIDGNTQPPKVTVSVQLTPRAGGSIPGSATVLCDVSGQGSVWQYNAHTGWPAFPFDLPGER